MGLDLSKIAQPNDEDLDLDVDGVTIASVQRMGYEIWLLARGGWGSFVATDGSEFHADPGDEEAKITDLEMVAGFPDGPETMIDALVKRLEEWRDGQVPLRVCGAPGRMFTLIEHRGRWLPFPRGPKADRESM